LRSEDQDAKVLFKTYLGQIQDLVLKKYLQLEAEEGETKSDSQPSSYLQAFLLSLQDFDHTSPSPLLPCLLPALPTASLPPLLSCLATDYALTLHASPTLDPASLSKDLLAFLSRLLPPTYPPPTQTFLLTHVLAGHCLTELADHIAPRQQTRFTAQAFQAALGQVRLVKHIKTQVGKAYPKAKALIKGSQLQEVQGEVEETTVGWLASKITGMEGAQNYFAGGVYREIREKVGERWAIRVTVEALRRVKGEAGWP
jgi:hypothetical protein